MIDFADEASRARGATLARNVVVMALGRKGTGKSQLLWNRYTSRAPRVLSYGTLPQDLARDKDVVVALGMPKLMAALKQASRFKQWHIATELEKNDLVELFTMLCPPMGSEGRSLSEAYGGMALECGEVYEMFPNGQTPPELLAAPRRGRHYQLDMYFGAQRPSSCSRDVTAAADHIYAFAQSEPRDLAFLAGAISKPIADRVAQLGEHECVFFDRGTGVATLLDRHGRESARLNTFAESVRT